MTTVLPMGRGPPGGFRVVRAPGHKRRGVNGMTVADEVSGEGRTGACRVLVVKRCDHGALTVLADVRGGGCQCVVDLVRNTRRNLPI